MTLLLLCITLFYLGVALRLGITWFQVYTRDRSLSPQWKLPSLAIIIVASVLWVLVLPAAYLELLNKTRTAIDKVSTSYQDADLEEPLDPQPSFLKENDGIHR